MIYFIKTQRQLADSTYTNTQTAEFHVRLAENQSVNLKIVYLCFPIKIRKSSNIANDIDIEMVIVNNFFAHWIKEIEV